MTQDEQSIHRPGHPIFFLRSVQGVPVCLVKGDAGSSVRPRASEQGRCQGHGGPGQLRGAALGGAEGWGWGVCDITVRHSAGLVLRPSAGSAAPLWPGPAVSAAAGGGRCWAGRKRRPARGLGACSDGSERSGSLRAALRAVSTSAGLGPCCLPAPSPPLLPDPRGCGSWPRSTSRARAPTQPH